MAQLGSTKRPAIVRVHSESQAAEIMKECEANGWQVIVGIEPDKPADISHIKKLRNRSPMKISTTERFRPLSGNNFCPCGSGKRYKKCCQPKNNE